MRKYFGTDGVRGVANSELTPELAFKLGRAGGYVLTQKSPNKKVVVGKDSRISGDMLESALSAGLMSVGIEVMKLGLIPTPAVAYMTKNLGAQAGVMISASHNPFLDNGIKFFNETGFKLTDEQEERIEYYLEHQQDIPRPIAEHIGTITEYFEGVEKYIHCVKSKIGDDLSGLKIILDCANGAASSVARRIFVDLGAEVQTIHSQPNGININVQCGSTHVESLQEKVLQEEADIGFAFDGDADRLIAINEKGEIMDGDDILYIWGTFLKEKGQLKNNAIVATVMSNFGLKKALKEKDIWLEETKVGDRYVLEKMLDENRTLGGEQSGHLIQLDLNTTGDGVTAAAQLAYILKQKGKKASKLTQGFVKYPQILQNVHVSSKDGWDQKEIIRQAIQVCSEQLKDRGRILVRASGTESLIRVMAEGEQQQEIEEIVQILSQLIQKECS